MPAGEEVDLKNNKIIIKNNEACWSQNGGGKENMVAFHEAGTVGTHPGYVFGAHWRDPHTTSIAG